MLSRSSFRRPTNRVAALTVGAALAMGLTALPAQAADNASLTKDQAAVTARITARLTTLANDQTTVAGAKDLTSADSAALNTLLSADVSGLTALKAKVATETTDAAVHADAVTMVDSYRVYMLVDPKVRLTRVLDAEADVATRLAQVHTALAAKLAADPDDNTPANQALLSDIATQIAADQAADSGQDAALAAIQPGPDDQAIEASVKTVRDAAKTARADFAKAVADAKQIRGTLKS
jgi:hypothetical protein